MPSPTDDEISPFPPPAPAPPYGPSLVRSHLSPLDAALAIPPSSRRSDGPLAPGNESDSLADAASAPLSAPTSHTRLRLLPGERPRPRRRKRSWRKLMWVKQSYPDNYTDQETFLENLQRNPRLKPYDFWPLVADSTVILQHVCSVIIFVICFVGIFQERVSPVSVVSWTSFATLLGWFLWEQWVAEEEEDEGFGPGQLAAGLVPRSASIRRRGRAASMRAASIRPLPTLMPSPPLHPPPATAARSMADSASLSASDTLVTTSSTLSLAAALPPGPPPPPPPTSPGLASSSGPGPSLGPGPSVGPSSGTDTKSTVSHGLPPLVAEELRAHKRLGTVKSALLIYCTLLGLSPILKSLTRSTSSDSIWAMSFWLLAVNIFFFDYSGGVGTKFPASLSTNAALMASTVLASRLPSTKQVFSLTLFSMQVFGLFPVFRRHVRHRFWRYHVLLTVLLVLGAGLGVGMVLGDGRSGGRPWKSGIVGMVVGVLMAALATGGCSWWLIGLQKYKNEIRGPWDPARPIIMSRARWNER